VRAAIEVLAGLDGKRWLVLGDMAELGEFAESSHTEMGSFAREQGIERLYATGKLAALAVERFGSGARWFADTQALANALLADASPPGHAQASGSNIRLLI
jgi:UDP-N-acetylmuramoyl-tripeptide--D-alanyl-D-alanine ligase